MATGARPQGTESATVLLIMGASWMILPFSFYLAHGLLAGRLGPLIKNRRHTMFRNRFFALLFAGAGMQRAPLGDLST